MDKKALKYKSTVKKLCYGHTTPRESVFYKENCCGCSACYAICPVGAIDMKVDEEGFLYPEIDRKRCLQCNACIDVCAFKKDQKEKGYMKSKGV